jgi:hypothetical protein
MKSPYAEPLEASPNAASHDACEVMNAVASAANADANTSAAHPSTDAPAPPAIDLTDNARMAPTIHIHPGTNRAARR